MVTTQGGDKKFLAAAVNSIPFDSSGILLLPGNHNFFMKISKQNGSKECDSVTELNQVQYSACLDSQRKARSERALVIPTCNIDNYTTTKRHCLVPMADYECSGSAELKIGSEYELRIDANSNSRVSVSLDLERAASGERPNKTVATWACNFLVMRTERQVD